MKDWFLTQSLQKHCENGKVMRRFLYTKVKVYMWAALEWMLQQLNKAVSVKYINIG